MICSRAWIEARRTALPMWYVLRLDVVDASNGITSVSSGCMKTLSIGTLSSSAATCERIVLQPWPISTVPASTVTSPLLFTKTPAFDVVGDRVGFWMHAKPLPIFVPDLVG